MILYHMYMPILTYLFPFDEYLGYLQYFFLLQTQLSSRT